MKAIKQPDMPFIPTANLVDIAILLIIFYMACSNFMAQSAVTITPPTAKDLTTQKQPLALVTVDSNGDMYLQGQRVQNVEEIKVGIQALIRDRSSADGKMVMFKCDASTSEKIFEPVLAAIVDAGGIVMAVGDMK